MSNNKIVIIYQEPGKKPVYQKIKNDIAEIERMIGGETENIFYEDIVIVCKKERKNLRPNIYINKEFLSIGETIRGNIIIVNKEKNQLKTLTKEEVLKYLEFLKNASFHYDNVDENGRLLILNDNNYIKRFEQRKNPIDRQRNNEENENLNNSKALKMILGIQATILKFIKDNKEE